MGWDGMGGIIERCDGDGRMQHCLTLSCLLVHATIAVACYVALLALWGGGDVSSLVVGGGGRREGGARQTKASRLV